MTKDKRGRGKSVGFDPKDTPGAAPAPEQAPAPAPDQAPAPEPETQASMDIASKMSVMRQQTVALHQLREAVGKAEASLAEARLREAAEAERVQAAYYMGRSEALMGVIRLLVTDPGGAE